MIGNILDNTTELYMIKYSFGEIFSSGGATLCKNPSDQTVWGRLTIQCKMSDYQVIKKSRPSHEAFVSGSLRYSFMDLYCVCMINCSTTFYNQDGSFHYLLHNTVGWW